MPNPINIKELIADREAQPDIGFCHIGGPLSDDERVRLEAVQRRTKRLPALEAAYIEAVEVIEDMVDAANSFQDDDGYEVAAQVRIRARKFLGDAE